jgi:hypothetical protein
MTALRKSLVPAVLVVVAAFSVALGQGPLQKRINFNINVPYSLKMGGYELPAGDYVLRQVSDNDLETFALYPGRHLMHSPIAMIRTIRINYVAGSFPGRTRLLLNIDEDSQDSHPVLRGWNIPGEDGWEVVSVVARGSVLAKAR